MVAAKIPIWNFEATVRRTEDGFLWIVFYYYAESDNFSRFARQRAQKRGDVSWFFWTTVRAIEANMLLAENEIDYELAGKRDKPDGVNTTIWIAAAEGMAFVRAMRSLLAAIKTVDLRPKMAVQLTRDTPEQAWNISTPRESHY